MDYYAIDASFETANICVVDQEGAVLREEKVVARPEALIVALPCPFSSKDSRYSARRANGAAITTFQLSRGSGAEWVGYRMNPFRRGLPRT